MKSTAPKQRDWNKVLHLQGRINLSTRSESIGKKKYLRKIKHKKCSLLPTVL